MDCHVPGLNAFQMLRGGLSGTVAVHHWGCCFFLLLYGCVLSLSFICMFFSWRWRMKTLLMYFNNRREAPSLKRTVDKPRRTLHLEERPSLFIMSFFL